MGGVVEKLIMYMTNSIAYYLIFAKLLGKKHILSTADILYEDLLPAHCCVGCIVMEIACLFNYYHIQFRDIINPLLDFFPFFLVLNLFRFKYTFDSNNPIFTELQFALDFFLLAFLFCSGIPS